MATEKIAPAPLTRTLHDIAAEVFESWGDRMYFGAVPYLDAMMESFTTDLSDTFHDDDLDTVVLYALSNMSTWRGETAKRVKAELKAAREYHKINRHLPTD